MGSQAQGNRARGGYWEGVGAQWAQAGGESALLVFWEGRKFNPTPQGLRLHSWPAWPPPPTLPWALTTLASHHHTRHCHRASSPPARGPGGQRLHLQGPALNLGHRDTLDISPGMVLRRSWVQAYDFSKHQLSLCWVSLRARLQGPNRSYEWGGCSAPPSLSLSLPPINTDCTGGFYGPSEPI